MTLQKDKKAILSENEEGVFGVFGAIKWVIIGSIILLVGVLLFKVYSGIIEWQDENCEAGQSTAQCLAEGATLSLGDLVVDVLLGVGAAVNPWTIGKNIGGSTQKYNIFANAQKIWRHYF